MRSGRVALAALLLLACSPDEDRPGDGGLSRGEVSRQVRELYERAREAGDDVPADVYAWAREDVGRIGDWEYRVLRLADGGDDALQERLGALGDDRWEVFWLEPRDGAYRVFLKRPARSVLQRLPLSQLGRLVPGGSASE